MAPSRHDWKIVDWDVKPQHNQPTNQPIFLELWPFENLGFLKFVHKISQSKKISNDQKQIQSDPTSCPQNQKGNN